MFANKNHNSKEQNKVTFRNDSLIIKNEDVNSYNSNFKSFKFFNINSYYNNIYDINKNFYKDNYKASSALKLPKINIRSKRNYERDVNRTDSNLNIFNCKKEKAFYKRKTNLSEFKTKESNNIKLPLNNAHNFIVLKQDNKIRSNLSLNLESDPLSKFDFKNIKNKGSITSKKTNKLLKINNNKTFLNESNKLQSKNCFKSNKENENENFNISTTNINFINTKDFKSNNENISKKNIRRSFLCCF